MKIKCALCGKETKIRATKTTKKLTKLKWICEDCYDKITSDINGFVKKVAEKIYYNIILDEGLKEIKKIEKGEIKALADEEIDKVFEKIKKGAGDG